MYIKYKNDNFKFINLIYVYFQKFSDNISNLFLYIHDFEWAYIK